MSRSVNHLRNPCHLSRERVKLVDHSVQDVIYVRKGGIIAYKSETVYTHTHLFTVFWEKSGDQRWWKITERQTKAATGDSP